jgi:hypothetical protein
MLIHAYTRSESTPIELFGLQIVFAANAADHFVAEVSDERAIARLLSIKEAFCEYSGDAPVAVPATALAPVVAVTEPVAAADADSQPEAPKGHSSHDFPNVIEIADGKTVALVEVVAAALSRSELNVEEWNLNDEEDRDALIEAEVELMRKAEAETTGAEDADPLVLKADDGTTVDLGAMSAKDVRAFAAQNGVTLPGGNSTKVADLRLMVAQALTKA